MKRSTNISPGAAYDRIRKYMAGRDASLEDAIGKLKERHAVATKERVDEIVASCSEPQALTMMLSATNWAPKAVAASAPEDGSPMDAANAPYEESHPAPSPEQLPEWLTKEPPPATRPIVVDRSEKRR